MRRPPIGSRIIRGLRSIAALACVELEAGDDGAFGGQQSDMPDVQAALTYVYKLCNWHEAVRKEKDGAS